MSTTFKQFLQESTISTTKRQSITHLQDMKPLVFLRWCKKLLKDSDGKLENISTMLKVDGLSGRFGKDANGKFFFETGKSGPIQTAKAFSNYNKEKGSPELIMQRAVHYDHIYEVLKKSDLWQHLPKDTKVVCEILYNPMAEKTPRDKLRFVLVEYDKKKLGDLMTVVPISVINASSGEPHPEAKKLLKQLLAESTGKIRVISPELPALSLSIKAELESVSALDENAEKVLSSLKHADKQLKQEYTTALASIKDKVADKILNHPIKGKDILGTQLEGIIVELDGKLYKVTTSDFKAKKKAEKEAQKKSL